MSDGVPTNVAADPDRDSLAKLLDAPVIPLRPDWTVPARVEQLAAARALDGPDAYWEWVAHQQRWSTPWTAVRTGTIDDFRYFDGGRSTWPTTASTGGPRTPRQPAAPRSCGRASPATRAR